MRAGPLDRRVMVQVKATTRDDTTGELVESWTDVRRLWMGKREPRADETFSADQVTARIDTIFEARWQAVSTFRPDTHRLVYRDRVYNILGMPERGRQDRVEIFCAARAEAAFGESS